MRSLKRISLVVPCFNEAARLDADALRAASVEGRELELVLVDDGSSDGTRAALERVARDRPRTRVVALERNSGKGEAVRRGMLDALGTAPDAAGFWDADMSTPLSELPSFIGKLEEQPELEIVIGSRVMLMGRTIRRRAWRHYLGRVFATAASIALDLPVYDTQCGAKLFRVTPLLARVFEEPFLSRWAFDVEIFARFAAMDPRGPDALRRTLYELPLMQWTHVRGSKIKAHDFARAALDVAIIRARYPPR